jgi:hypothetical protein
MKVTAFYKLPMNDETAANVIHQARAVGHPVLAVVLEVEDKPNRSSAGFALGTKVAELDVEIQAAGGAAHFAESFESLDGS